MKKYIYSAIFILAVVSACKENDPVVFQNTEILKGVVENYTTTKTIIDDANNVLWAEDDQIIVFLKSSSGKKYKLDPSSIGKNTGIFTLQANGTDDSEGSEFDHNVAFYPYSGNVYLQESEEKYQLIYDIPVNQTYMKDSFGNGAFPMVAVSNNKDLQFKNIFGAILLQLKGKYCVKSIKLEGKNKEKLSGATIIKAYSNNLAPIVQMTGNHSYEYVQLDCGSGVELKENEVTNFYIALPPVLFSKGFKVTITTTDNQTKVIETNSANTVLRSYLLTMPIVYLGDDVDYNPDNNDDLIVPVSYVELNTTKLKLGLGDTFQLTANVGPRDATYKNVTWSSNASDIAIVDQTGTVTAMSVGSTKIFAQAGGVVSTCTVSVVSSLDYIDEYGVNHGKGVIIGNSVWSPVNCGYHKDDYKYGKLYQFGRKYGQGYNGEFHQNGELTGTYSDISYPQIEEGGVSAVSGSYEGNANKFYLGVSAHGYNWVDPEDDYLWNKSESYPVKTKYDPCPSGWRVPTRKELEELCMNYSEMTSYNNQEGYWMSGPNSYSSNVTQIFLPATGERYGRNIWSYSNEAGVAENRGFNGIYWSSTPRDRDDGNYHSSYYLFLSPATVHVNAGSGDRASGRSIRCVQE
mgnify:CR=1 FL=1